MSNPYTKCNGTPTTNAERIRRYKGRCRDAGLRHLDLWVSPELVALIDRKRKPSECRARTLERLLRVSGK